MRDALLRNEIANRRIREDYAVPGRNYGSRE